MFKRSLTENYHDIVGEVELIEFLLFNTFYWKRSIFHIGKLLNLE